MPVEKFLAMFADKLWRENLEVLIDVLDRLSEVLDLVRDCIIFIIVQYFEHARLSEQTCLHYLRDVDFANPLQPFLLDLPIHADGHIVKQHSES